MNRRAFLSTAATALILNSTYSWRGHHQWQSDARWELDIWNCRRCGINVTRQYVEDTGGFPKTACWGIG